MTALVTGDQGFVGRHLVPKLEKAGYAVTGTENFDAYTLYRNTGYWKEVDFDVVVHLGANIRDVNQRQGMGVNACADIELDLQVCSWVQAHPPKQAFVVMSSCAVDNPKDPYCVVKQTLESFSYLLADRQVPVVILRPFSGYGEDQSEEYPFRAILERVRRREDPLVVWGGSQVRDFIHIEDLTDAIVHGIDNFPRAMPIQLGTGRGTSMFDLAQQMARRAGYMPVIQGDETKARSAAVRIACTSLAKHYGWESAVSLEDAISALDFG